LNEASEKYNGKLKLVGYWHKHPGEMSQPSSIDLATAQEIIKDRKKEGDSRLMFFIITNVINNEVKFYCYILNCNRFVSVPIEIIEDDSPEIDRALRNEPVIIQTKSTNFWDNIGFQFYTTPAGNERLQKEVGNLKLKGHEVKAYVKDTLRLVIRKDEILIALLPPEYPLNPPRLFKGETEIDYQIPNWNSTFTLVDVLSHLDKKTIPERRPYENHSLERAVKPNCIIELFKRTITNLRARKR